MPNKFSKRKRGTEVFFSFKRDMGMETIQKQHLYWSFPTFRNVDGVISMYYFLYIKMHKLHSYPDQN